MQILYVGNGNLKHRGARYYDTARRLCNGFTRNGHNVYFLSDRDTARASTIFGSQKLGIGYCNKVFLDTCYNLKPDLIVIGHADIISNQSMLKAREIVPNVKIAQFNVDAIFNPHTVEQIAAKAMLCDASFVTTAGPVLKQFSNKNSITAYIPNPVDSSIDWPKCFESSNQKYDVFWALRAMKGSYEGDPRIELPLYLEKSGKVDISYHGMNGKPPLYNSEYYKNIADARMGLNISNTVYRGNTVTSAPENLYLYSSDRISHYMGSGLLTFTTRMNSLEEIFEEDKELIFFSSKEELLEKIVFYKSNEKKRCEIAKAGWEKSHRCFNERLVAKFIIETTYRLPLSESYAWPTIAY